jgi:pilus assembly protein CpaD
MRFVYFAIADRRRIAAAAVRGMAIGGVTAMLAGCYTPREVTATIPTDYRQRHPIAIKEGERTVQIFVGSKRGGLTPTQRAEVLAFAGAWKREATGGIIIDLPSGTANELAAKETMREIRSILTAAGVPPRGVDVHPYQPADDRALATIKLNYPRMQAQAGPCGLWPHDIGPSADPAYAENRPYWNLGCASQRNLASMVDNPADLVQPRGETPPYEPRRTFAVDKYRKGESPATNYPNKDQGKITDIGK